VKLSKPLKVIETENGGLSRAVDRTEARFLDREDVIAPGQNEALLDGGGLSKQREVVFGQPVHHAHVLYGTMLGLRPVPSDVRCGRYTAKERGIAAVEDAPDIDAVALLDGTGEELSLIAINTHPRDAVSVEVAMKGAAARPLRARIVAGPSYMTRNSIGEPEAASLRTIDPPAAGAALELPSHSVTEVVYRMR